MTDLESFRATLEHRPPGRVLYHFDFTEDLRRRVVEHIGTDDVEGHFGLMRTRQVRPTRPADKPPLDFSSYWDDDDLPENATLNEMGVARVPSGFYHFWGYVSPLRNAAELREIEEYPIDDCADWDTGHLADEVAAAHADGRIAVGWIGHMHEDAWQIRGYEQFLMDMIERPAWAHTLLERIAERNMHRAEAAARAGVDYLRCGDDVANQKAMMFSVPMWRDFMLARWSKVWARVAELSPETAVWYHSDGNIEPIVAELLDAGVRILNPLQPECLDIADLHQRFGNRVVFDGCIGTQSTMPWGTPDDVRQRVREVIEAWGRQGGLIVSPTHVLEPEVPIANIEALVDACREWGSQ